MNNKSLSQKDNRPTHNKHGASLQPLGPLKMKLLCLYISVEITILEKRWAYEHTLQRNWEEGLAAHCSGPPFVQFRILRKSVKGKSRTLPAPISAANNNIGRHFSRPPDTLCV